MPHNGAAADRVPVPVRRAVEHRHPVGLRLQQQRRRLGGPDDAFGFGFFPGQFGMAVYSMYPIDFDAVRTFQLFRWEDMPGAAAARRSGHAGARRLVLARGARGRSGCRRRSHWDLPIDIDGRTVHFLVSHPTPPVFDGAEDRNGTRNFDEIRFWADYITPGPASQYIYDDDGRHGGLQPGARFVIAGDQNSDPLDGDSIPGVDPAAPRPPAGQHVDDAVERRRGRGRRGLQGGANVTHESDPQFDTADFADNAPGNLRADYVLPSRPLRILDAGVFWPTSDDPLFPLDGDFPFPSSDHRMVWVDVTVPGGPRPLRTRPVPTGARSEPAVLIVVIAAISTAHSVRGGGAPGWASARKSTNALLMSPWCSGAMATCGAPGIST